MTLQLSCFILASLSCAAATVAVLSLFRVRKRLHGVSARSLAQLSSEVAELTSALESLLGQQRRLAARVGMREVRQRRETADETVDDGGPVGEKILPKHKLKEIARARGFKVS
jgi:hypothetical protein